MNKLIATKQAIKISNDLRKNGKTIVLAGGFFDILHVGHIKFLKKAKEQGDFLFIFLESDEKARKVKGENRPINSRKDRAFVLSALQSVDYIIALPQMTKDEQYDKLILQIKPNVIATTYGDPNIIHKKRQAKQIKGKLIEVMRRIDEHSTTRLAKLIN